MHRRTLMLTLLFVLAGSSHPVLAQEPAGFLPYACTPASAYPYAPPAGWLPYFPSPAFVPPSGYVPILIRPIAPRPMRISLSGRISPVPNIRLYVLPGMPLFQTNGRAVYQYPPY
jgi:hypothetical protein